jgi:hypothetical protein
MPSACRVRGHGVRRCSASSRAEATRRPMAAGRHRASRSRTSARCALPPTRRRAHTRKGKKSRTGEGRTRTTYGRRTRPCPRPRPRLAAQPCAKRSKRATGGGTGPSGRLLQIGCDAAHRPRRGGARGAHAVAATGDDRARAAHRVHAVCCRCAGHLAAWDTMPRGISCRVGYHDARDIMPRGQEMLCRVGYFAAWDTVPRGTLACMWQALARRRSACHGTCTARRPSSQTGGSVRAFSTWAYPATDCRSPPPTADAAL